MNEAEGAIPDRELVARAVDGDQAAFAGLVGRFAPRLHRSLTATGLPAADADDVVQESFIRAHRNLHRYDPRYAVTTWLFTIAHRLAVNWRARRRHAPLPEDAGGAIPGPAPADGRDDGIWELARARLSDRDHRALWLRYGEDLSPAEIGSVLGISEGNAKVVLHRARARLADVLASPAGRAVTVLEGAAHG